MATDNKLHTDIASSMNVDLAGYRLNFMQKQECHRLIGLMSRLSDDIKKRSKTLVPGSDGSKAMLAIWRTELQLIEARIRNMIQEVIRTNTGPDGYGRIVHDLTTNANTNHPTKLPANTMKIPGPRK